MFIRSVVDGSTGEFIGSLYGVGLAPRDDGPETEALPMNLASAERGAVSRSSLGLGSALRLTEPRSVRVAGFKGATRRVLFRGILTPPDVLPLKV